MTAITIRFKGFYERILDSMKESGLAESKSEAIRFALFKTAVDYGFVNEETLLESLQSEAAKNPLSVKELVEGIEDAKKATIRR